MNTIPLLKLLSDGEVHSGESLAASLGISRTAIWKQVRKLLDKGIEVKTIRGRGYQLASPMDLVTREGIEQSLSDPARKDMALKVLGQVDSTNTDITRRWQDGERGLLVSVADSQQQGRGRRGRVWQSPPGQNLYMSVGVSLNRGFTELDGLSLVAGLALLEALADKGLSLPTLKWPNDVLVEGRKLAGILIELQGELEGVVRVIVGIGVNVHMQEASSVDQPWTSLDLCGPATDWRRDELAAGILNRLVDYLSDFESSGFTGFAEQWNRFDAFKGRKLVASSGNLAGIGRGVDETGNYLLETTDGLERVYAGEISLRVAQ
ncbi:biotin--[acetyl-CoA-carboxylase] ligase [Marinobacter bryozoorum]|uniref:biotin--[acetyl-CoA-carboxylase] ligase n=1 Tax=Marinobacter bryozoorum TaxID=256324 RepID=UPI002003E919|nr:biotin--[acetyl-CoA-carboxylase] ligase [Marinobacter bryozoorum]MCK7545694.1 biotin--[acetyl-CoA-carboxylase] ligase [Marinobacter bryozoorum]